MKIKLSHMGSYLYDYGDAKSPFSDIIKAPEFMKPITETIYAPISHLC